MDTELVSIYELLAAAHDLPYGAAQVDRIKEVVRRADALNLHQAQIDARVALVESATFSGQPQESLIAFTWLLPHYEESPEENNAWIQFRWITEDIVYIPEISAQQIEETLGKMAAFFQREYWWMHPVYEAQARWYRVLRDRERLSEALEKWGIERLASGHTLDLHDRHFLAESFLCLDDYDRAFRESGLERNPSVSVFEAEYPHRTLALMCRPTREHDPEAAEHFYKRGLALCYDNPVFFRELGWLLAYAAEEEKLDDAKKLLRRGFTWSQNSVDAYAKANFYRAARTAFENGASLPDEMAEPDDVVSDLMREFSDRHGNSELADELRVGPFIC